MVAAEGVFPETAKAYCEAIGRRLVTEEQWEYAARSGTDNFYPWGNEPPECSWAAFDQAMSLRDVLPQCPKEQPRAEDGGNETRDITTKNGIKNMFGNVSEITASRFVSSSNPETVSKLYYVVKGTNYLSLREMGFTSYRSKLAADESRIGFGFRCAK
jgi:formylglycine-generating enzyme required for sulfatase activity